MKANTHASQKAMKAMTTEQIKVALESIRGMVDDPIESDDWKAVQDRLMYVASVLAWTASMVSDAKRNLLRKQDQTIAQLSGSSLPASIMAMQVKSKCGEEEATYEEAERMNKAVTRIGEWCQTIISARKEEMKLQGMNLTPQKQ